MIVAVDGPAASGKGTLARRIAAHFNIAYLDTGALYRAVARDVIATGSPVDDPSAAAQAAQSIDANTLDDPVLRTRGTGEAASIVAQFPAVRAALLDFQRAFANQARGAVLDGRDIGTVVCPQADAKIYVVAAVEERAKRRWKELNAAGLASTYDSILADLVKRDARDRQRESAPLKPASDAHLLDTTNLDIEAAFEAAVELIDAAIGRAN